MFEKNKSLLITGGTGSFGNAVLRRFLFSDISEIRIFSRDEKKQDDMRKRYNSPKLKFYIGDVRDPQSVMNAVRGVDYVYHAAALKQVPSCEFHPLEAVKTNVLGTENVLEAAIQCGVQRAVVLSTDKAVYPINAMGISKAMMEKVAVAKSRSSAQTVINVTRYGNVMASRGSVIPLFIEQIRAGKPITLTDPNMTRFMMTLDDAVDLVFYAFKHGQPGEIFVQKAPAATIEVLAKALTALVGKPDHEVRVTGLRPGEKLYEELLIGDNPKPTQHPRIMKAQEQFISWPQLQDKLNVLSMAVGANDVPVIRALLQQLVSGYQPSGEVVDWVHLANLREVVNED